MYKKAIKHLHDFFIPHEGNDHKPHSVRHSSLWMYGLILVLMKATLVLGLFATFPDFASFSSITQEHVVSLTNQARRANGLASVTINPTLQQVAQLKLDDMIRNGYFAHTSPDGLDPWYWFKKAGYLYTYAGENLAMNFVEAEELNKAWLKSPTHRANILNPNYREIGVAVGIGEVDGFESTLVVQMFGTSFAPPKISKRSFTAPAKVKGEKTSSPQAEKAVSSNASAPKTRDDAVEKIALFKSPESEGGISKDAPIPTPIEPDSSEPIPLESPVEEKTNLNKPPIEGMISPEAGVREVVFVEPAPSGLFALLIKYSRVIPYILIIFIIASLLMKVFIKFHIQHKKLIIHAIIIILLGLALIWLNIHFLEPVAGSIILG